MEKKPIDFVKLLYEFDPYLADWEVGAFVMRMFPAHYAKDYPSFKTISVWKARLRKRGVLIPDKRGKKLK